MMHAPAVKVDVSRNPMGLLNVLIKCAESLMAPQNVQALCGYLVDIQRVQHVPIVLYLLHRSRPSCRTCVQFLMLLGCNELTTRS